MISRHPSRGPLLALAVAVVITAAGCDSSNGSSSSTTLRTGGFIAQLGDACRVDVAGIKSAPKTVAGEAPVQRRFIATLQSLKPTQALRADFDRYVALLQQNLTAFEHHNTAAGKQLRTQIAPVLATLRHTGVKGC